MILILIVSLAFACDERAIICNTVCQHDDDEIGIILNNKCYCANSKDVSKFVIRVPKHGAMIQVSKPKPIWE